MSNESSNDDRRAEIKRRALQKIFDSMPAQVEAIRQARERKIAELALFMAAREVNRKSR